MLLTKNDILDLENGTTIYAAQRPYLNFNAMELIHYSLLVVPATLKKSFPITTLEFSSFALVLRSKIKFKKATIDSVLNQYIFCLTEKEVKRELAKETARKRKQLLEHLHNLAVSVEQDLNNVGFEKLIEEFPEYYF